MEIPTSPMVARAMLRLYKRMNELHGGGYEEEQEFYQALVDALEARLDRARENLLRHILEGGPDDELDN